MIFHQNQKANASINRNKAGKIHREWRLSAAAKDSFPLVNLAIHTTLSKDKNTREVDENTK